METEQKELEENLDYKDRYLRTLADLENIKKRFSKERDEIINKTKEKTIEVLLDMDNELFIAIDNEANEDIKTVLKLFKQKLETSLKKENISVIDDEYNSDIHEVISIINSNDDGFKIIANGYRLDNKIIRYPKVILYKKNN